MHHNAIPAPLELCLDICTPATLGALYLDHTNYIAAHQDEDDAGKWGAMDMIQQDADEILAHLSTEHFHGDPAAAIKYINALNHIPF